MTRFFLAQDARVDNFPCVALCALIGVMLHALKPRHSERAARRIVIERPREGVENGIDRVAHIEKRAVGTGGVHAFQLRA